MDLGNDIFDSMERDGYDVEDICDINTDNIIPATKEMGTGVDFQRIRRITGYLSEEKNFNDGKRAELKDRVKHSAF